MKIGKLVQKFIPKIIEHCKKFDQEEINRLQDIKYSKQIFDINFSFFLHVEDIRNSNLHDKYWKATYEINNKSYRVCNDWFVRNTDLFYKYLISKNIVTEDEISELILKYEKAKEDKIEKKLRQNSRYRGNAIGNAQNLLVRNILSNLGDESFGGDDWKETKQFFGNRCAYCGEEKNLVIEHAIPINKTMLGEHRLGNLVPSCNECNSKKSSLSYKEFLEDDQDKIKKIKEYMKLKNYEPLANNEKSEIVAELLEKAYLDTAEIAKRYIQIIELIQNNDE